MKNVILYDKYPSNHLHEHNNDPGLFVGGQLSGDVVKLGDTSSPVDGVRYGDTQSTLCRQSVHDLGPHLAVHALRVDQRYVRPVVVDQQVYDRLGLIGVGRHHASEVRVLRPVAQL